MAWCRKYLAVDYSGAAIVALALLLVEIGRHMWLHFFRYGPEMLGIAFAAMFLGGYGIGKGGAKALWKVLTTDWDIPSVPQEKTGKEEKENG